MKAKLIVECTPAPSAMDDDRIEKNESGRPVWPVGTIIEGPKAFRLVQMGVAEPDDAECRLRCAMTTKEMKKAQRHQKAVAAGIVPEDYQRFFDGEIVGYNADGSDIKGPNWVDRSNEDEDDDDDD